MSKSKINFGSKNNVLGAKKPVKVAKIEYSSDERNLERDSAEELSELEKQLKAQFRAKAQYEASLKAANTSTEFYSVITFKTQDQRDEFLRLLGIKEQDNRFVNGQKLIQALELNIEKVNLKNPGKFQCNKDISSLAMEL